MVLLVISEVFCPQREGGHVSLAPPLDLPMAGLSAQKPEGKVMVPILTWLLDKYIYVLKSCRIIIFLFSNMEAAIFNFGTLQHQKEENLLQVWVGSKKVFGWTQTICIERSWSETSENALPC